MAVALKDRKRVTAELKTWLDDVSSYEREFKKWDSRVEKILKRYRDERTTGDEGAARFNILHSNVQTLIPAVFSKLPQPDVSRRFRDNDPVGRVASLIMERSLEFEINHYQDYRATMRESVLDRFLGGRGSAWIRYEPHFKDAEQPDGVEITDDADEGEEQLDYECAPIDYVHWKDFGHSVARTWEEVTRVWRIVYMTRDGIKERFGDEMAKAIPMDASPQEVMASPEYKPGDPLERAKIFEGWDKEDKCAVWFSKSVKDFLDRRDDPLGLEGFFPCPKPLYATLTNDKLVPVPDFVLYQDQANSLDTLADRIRGLIEALKVMGTYDASVPELSRLFTEGKNGSLVPVKNFAAFAEKNGLTGALSIVDLKPIADALEIAYQAFQQEIGYIYQVTGIADIVRGQTDPDETLGAQELKGQFASLRLRDIQNAVAQYATECIQLKAQVYCRKFSPESLLTMSSAKQLAPEDQQYIPQALELLVGPERMQDPQAEGRNPLRDFRIEVNADTLVQFDENAEKQRAVEFMQGVGEFLKNGAQIGAAAPQLVPLLLECLKWGVSRFKVGKTLEGTIDQAIDDMKKQIQMQQSQPPQPDPKQEAIKAKAAADTQKAQMDVQVAKAKAGIEMQKMQGEQQMQQQQMQIDQQKNAQEMAMDQQRMQMEQQGMVTEHQMRQEQAKETALMKQQQAAAVHRQRMAQAMERKPQGKPS